MSYSSMGQIPDNGGYLPGGGDRNGIFGQVPDNGGYVVGLDARKPIFGYGQIPAGALYVAPPYYDDNGLRRIDQQSLPTFAWSVNTTSTDEPNAGSSMQELPGFVETFSMEIASGVGNYWLDTYLSAGFVVLFWGKSPEQLGSTLRFAISKDPMYIAANAATAANFAMVIDGPEAIITQAKQLLGDVPTAPTIPTGGCPPGTVGIPPFCIGTPTGVPTVPGVPTAPTKPTEPPPTKPTEPPSTAPTKPTEPPPPPIEAKVVSKAPTWLLPALIGVAAVSVFAIVRAGGSKRR